MEIHELYFVTKRRAGIILFPNTRFALQEIQIVHIMTSVYNFTPYFSGFLQVARTETYSIPQGITVYGKDTVSERRYRKLN